MSRRAIEHKQTSIIIARRVNSTLRSESLALSLLQLRARRPQRARAISTFCLLDQPCYQRRPLARRLQTAACRPTGCVLFGLLSAACVWAPAAAAAAAVVDVRARAPHTPTAIAAAAAADCVRLLHVITLRWPPRRSSCVDVARFSESGRESERVRARVCAPACARPRVRGNGERLEAAAPRTSAHKRTHARAHFATACVLMKEPKASGGGRTSSRRRPSGDSPPPPPQPPPPQPPLARFELGGRLLACSLAHQLAPLSSTHNAPPQSSSSSSSSSRVLFGVVRFRRASTLAVARSHACRIRRRRPNLSARSRRHRHRCFCYCFLSSSTQAAAS